MFGWCVAGLVAALLVGLVLPPRFALAGSLVAFMVVVALGAAWRPRYTRGSRPRAARRARRR
jgi:membrane protein implicated in regulation of membrane protease activity